MNTRTLKNLMMAGLASLAISISANATTLNLGFFDDDRYLGYYKPSSVPVGSEAGFIDFLKDSGAPNPDIDGTYEFNRNSNFAYQSSPNAGTHNPLVTNDLTGEFSIDGVSFVLGKYVSDWSFVWYVGEPMGAEYAQIVIMPDFLLSVQLFQASDQRGGNNAPDGGVTLMLLGSALAGLAFLGRRWV